MSKIEGVAKKFDGTAIDYVSIFEWERGKCIAQVVPDASGAWDYVYYFDLNVGITYVADGCEPITHGAYEFIDTENLIVNGNFKNDLSSWFDRDSHWRWVNGRAHFPPTSLNRPFSQQIGSHGLVKVMFDIEVVSGSAEYYILSNGSFLHPTTELGIGVHKIEFTSQTDADAIIYFSRVPSTGTVEFYLDNVVVVKV